MIQDRMFEPIGGTGTPSLTDLTSTGQNQPSLLDRATQRLKDAQADTRAANADIRKDNDATRARNDKALADQGKAGRARTRSESADNAAATAEANAKVLDRRAKLAAEQATNRTALLQGLGADSLMLASMPSADEMKKQAAALQKEADAAKAEATRLRQEASKVADVEDSVAAPRPTEGLKEEQSAPSISVVATLEMKKVKQSGTFHFEMNKTMPDNRTLTFSENIGDLRRLKSDPAHFHQINMDDPLFKQRELVAMVDVANAQDFGQFVNFVDVQMRKKHATGEPTFSEVRVDRNNFNKEGNNFKLLYGWKGDNDRSKWLEYEVQATWSMFGGKTVVDPWRKSTDGAIDLRPPYRRRTVTFDGSPETLTAADVRAVTVQVFYDVAGAEQSKQLTLNVAKGQVADKVEILSGPNNSNYAYQLTWQLKGNKTLQTQRQTTVSDIVYVDELPAH
jgi:hypothetical protein